MTKRKLLQVGKLFLIIIIICITVIPYHVSGEVQPITELQEKLEGISEEEKAVLEKLFTITQELEELEREIANITVEINSMQIHIQDLENKIEDKQVDYNRKLEVLEQVLTSYQRGGPATYLEILLSADNLADFLKSINIVKDISRNTEELLDSLKEGKKVLQEEKDKLAESITFLEQKKAELEEPLLKQQQLKVEQEDYLISLQEEREHYQEQLGDLVQIWEDCKLLFSEIMSEFAEIVGEGYFTMEDLNLSLGFFKMQGVIYEDTFNKIMKEHSDLPETIFYFYADQVVIEVPEKHLILSGSFVIAGETSILFEVKEGSFYAMPLEVSSMEELFRDGPMLIDFKELAGDMIIIDFTLNKVQMKDGSLAFEILPRF